MTEQEQAILDIQAAVTTLERLGWRQMLYAPRETEVEIIEAGSTGIHRAEKNDLGWWIDGDWPCYSPILWREIP